MNMINTKNAQIFLLLNSIFWGSSYIWSKMLLSYLPQFSILLICSICGLVCTLAVFGKKLIAINLKGLFISFLVCLVSVLSNTFCMLALGRTSGSNTAFIVQLSIVITPTIIALLDKRLPSGKTTALALIAILGIYFITCNGKGLSIGPGDFFALCNAVCFSIFLALQNKTSHLINPAQFTFVQHSTNTVAFCILAFIFETGKINITLLHCPTFLLLIGLNSIVVIFTAIFQSSEIKFVRPESATILYSFEPVVAGILGIALLGEKFGGGRYIIGCLLILLSALLTVIPLKLNGISRPIISTNSYPER